MSIDSSARAGGRTAPCLGLQGLTVVLSGAAGGIGQALAAAFAAQQVRLIITDRDAGALQRAAQALGPGERFRVAAQRPGPQMPPGQRQREPALWQALAPAQREQIA